MKLLCQWSQNTMTTMGHCSLVCQLLQHTSVIPTPCLVHSKGSVNNDWKQGEREREGGEREEKRKEWGTRIGERKGKMQERLQKR